MELAVSHGKDHTDRHKHGVCPGSGHFTGNGREKQKGIFRETTGKRAGGQKSRLLHKPIHDGAQASLKKPAQELPCDKCGDCWIYSIVAPLQYVQGYLWIIMLICSVALFSQMGCREHENGLTECFVTIKSSLVRQMIYSYLWAAVILFMISMPAIIRCFGEQKFLCSCSYIAFSFFIPALGLFFRGVFQIAAGF